MNADLQQLQRVDLVMRPARPRCSGFSLIEMLVGMGILSILVLALFAMFDQTQKAMLANVNQSDVMESGRLVVDLLNRDLVRARPANLGTNYIFFPGTSDVSEDVPPSTNFVILRTTAGLASAVAQNLFLDGWRRTALFDDVFYLAERQPGNWVGAGLFVAPEDSSQPDSGIGTLYRYEDARSETLRGLRAGFRARELYRRFFEDANYRSNNASRLVDGVIFFRVTAFGRSGEALDPTLRFQTNRFPNPPGVLIGPDNTIDFPLNATLFQGTAFPSAIELELGVLPTELLERFRSLPETQPGVRTRFLTNNAANVLVFRSRIPMPTSTPAFQ